MGSRPATPRLHDECALDTGPLCAGLPTLAWVSNARFVSALKVLGPRRHCTAA